MDHAGLTYFLDPELKIAHLYIDCIALKNARLYQYWKKFHIYTVAEAGKLDKEGYRSCHRCWKKEVYEAGRKGRRLRPGYVKEPRK